MNTALTATLYFPCIGYDRKSGLMHGGMCTGMSISLAAFALFANHCTHTIQLKGWVWPTVITLVADPILTVLLPMHFYDYGLLKYGNAIGTLLTALSVFVSGVSFALHPKVPAIFDTKWKISILFIVGLATSIFCFNSIYRSGKA